MSPEDLGRLVGRKVSIRFRLDDPSHPFSEAVGVVQSASGEAGAERVSILKRQGGLVTVALDDILAAKVFPL